MDIKKTLYLALLVATLTGCANETDRRPTVMVTIEPLRYFAEQIGGDRFRVVTMVPKGISPETYEPTAQQMAAMAHSELYIKAGSLGFERTWADRLEANARHLMTVDTSEGIEPVRGSTDAYADPHTWTSPNNAIVIARNIYRAMARVSIKDTAYFRANLDSLEIKIMDTHAAISRMMDEAHHRSFVIYHPALTYFARDYNIEQLPMEVNGREPSPASLKQLIDAARQKGTKLMFVQAEYSNRNTEIVAQAIGARTVEINPLSYDWQAELMDIATALCSD